MNSRMDESSSIPHDPYDDLPEAINQYYSRQEYLWLTDAEKAALLQRETEPEWT